MTFGFISKIRFLIIFFLYGALTILLPSPSQAGLWGSCCCWGSDPTDATSKTSLLHGPQKELESQEIIQARKHLRELLTTQKLLTSSSKSETSPPEFEIVPGKVYVGITSEETNMGSGTRRLKLTNWHTTNKNSFQEVSQEAFLGDHKDLCLRLVGILGGLFKDIGPDIPFLYSSTEKKDPLTFALKTQDRSLTPLVVYVQYALFDDILF